MPTSRILIFEPDVARQETYVRFIQERHFWVVATQNREEALQLLGQQHFHIAFWNVEGVSAAEELQKLRQVRAGTAFVVTSPNAAVGLVVSCMRAGASHFFDSSMGLEIFERVFEETLTRVLPEPTKEESLEFPLPNFVGRHPRVLEIFQLIMSIRNTDSTVLITGESGTGKEVVAKAIHDLSPRRRHPWVAVNCGAIPGALLESELFGHMKGAFTGATHNRLGRFQLAGSGTLFLDEISDLPFDLQAKLLRAIQNKEFEAVGSAHSQTLEARIIAASNQDLEKGVSEKRFREDLFYRLNVIPIFIPPLRARKSDIPHLARYFLEKFCTVTGKEFKGISEDSMQCLMDYHWPGNIRELENLMERVVVLKRDTGMIELKDIPVRHFRNIRVDRFVANVELPEEGLDFNAAVNEFENELILQALQRTVGNKNQAATLLNLNRTTLVEKLKRKNLRFAS